MKYFLFLLTICGCTTLEKRAAVSVLDLADKSCLLLRGQGKNNTVKTVCATEEELGPYVKDLIEVLPEHDGGAK